MPVERDVPNAPAQRDDFAVSLSVEHLDLTDEVLWSALREALTMPGKLTMA